MQRIWWIYLDVNCTKHWLEAWMFYAVLHPSHRHVCESISASLLTGVEKGVNKPEVTFLGFKMKGFNFCLDGIIAEGRLQFYSSSIAKLSDAYSFLALLWSCVALLKFVLMLRVCGKGVIPLHCCWFKKTKDANILLYLSFIMYFNIR